MPQVDPASAEAIALGGYLFAFMLSVAFTFLGVSAGKQVDRVWFGLGANLSQFGALLFFGWLLFIHFGAARP